MVKVLPDPVTPSRTWSLRPFFNPLDELLDGLGLVARRLEIGMNAERDRPLGRGQIGVDHLVHQLLDHALYIKRPGPKNKRRSDNRAALIKGGMRYPLGY